MTRLTALIIQTRDDVHVETFSQNSKHGFWITLGERHEPLLTSEPLWELECDAKNAGTHLVYQIRQEATA